MHFLAAQFNLAAQAMKRILLSLALLLGCLPLAALADGMVVPPVAYPVTVTIPDQRALICFSNGTERLVIETRFTGAGTNFAWVVPLPSQPVIEEATTGLFPTLQYLFRPEIVHNVPRYYAGILALIGIGSLLLFVRPSGRLKWTDILACLCVSVAAAVSSDEDTFKWVAFFFVGAILFCDVILIRIAQRSAFAVFGWTFLIAFCLCGLALPAGAPLSKGVIPAVSAEKISILERKIVGVFETTTIASHDATALLSWLSDNGYAVPTNAEPVIANYATNNWVFIAMKVQRESVESDTSTPHPLSFMFKTDKPVYPMQLTGLNGHQLSVDLYFFGNGSASAPHFKVESCTRPDILHPLLHRWTDGLPVATKLTATLSPAHMRKDVWLDQTPMFVEQKNRFFSRQGALTTALNWGMEIFGVGLIAICFLTFTNEKYKTRLPQIIGLVLVASIILGVSAYLNLPQIEVKLVRGGFRYGDAREQMLTLRIALDDLDCHTTAEVRAAFQKLVSNPTNAEAYYVKNWENHLAGGQFREEDSPGNYLLWETNNQLKLILIDTFGREDVQDTLDLPLRR